MQKYQAKSAMNNHDYGNLISQNEDNKYNSFIIVLTAMDSPLRRNTYKVRGRSTIHAKKRWRKRY